MRRPLVSLACGLALGIAAGETFALPPYAVLGAAGFFLLLALFFLFLRLPYFLPFIAATLAVAACGAGYARVRSAEFSSSQILRLLGDAPAFLRVRGTVLDRPVVRTVPRAAYEKEDPRRTDFTLAVSGIQSESEWKTVSGKIRVLAEGALPQLTRGDDITAAISLRKPRGPGNPGQVNAEAYLARLGIACYGSAGRDGIEITRKAGGPLALLESFRRRCIGLMEQTLPPEPAQILKTLILGERGALQDESDRAFRESGTIHFLAISGLHVMLLAGSIWVLLIFFGAGLRTAAAGVIAAVVLYSMLAGFQPGVVRAAVMCGLYCGGFLFRRKPDLASSMALALLLLLLAEPADLFNPGMQLSFAAVAGIALFARPLAGVMGRPDELDRIQAPGERSRWRRSIRWTLQECLAVSVAAWLATAPLLALHFGSISPWGAIASVALLPLAWLGTVAGLPGALLLPICGPVAKVFLWIAAGSAIAMERAAAFTASIPGAVIYLPPPMTWLLAVCAAAVAIIALRRRLRLARQGVFAVALIPALAYAAFVFPADKPRHLTVHMLDVGRANCLLVRFPDGRNLLFDAGGWNSDAGRRVIVPALLSLGVRRLDAVVLSHPHLDHINGFAEVARRIPVGRLMVSPIFDQSPDGADLLAAFGKRPRVERVAAGDRISGFGSASLDVLWPPREMPELELNENQTSIVLHIHSADGTVLLTGDFTGGAAGLLINSGDDLHADVLQVPHHGLTDNSSGTIAEAVGANIALVPGQEPQSSPYASASLYATETGGMITVELNDRSAAVDVFRK